MAVTANLGVGCYIQSASGIITGLRGTWSCRRQRGKGHGGLLEHGCIVIDTATIGHADSFDSSWYRQVICYQSWTHVVRRLPSIEIVSMMSSG